MAESQRLSVTFKPEAVGTVKATIGTVKAIDPSGAERVLIAGDKVYPNETLVTGPDGLVIVELANGHRIDLAHGSSLSLDEDVLALAATLAPAPGLTVEQLQEMIARGEDPAAIAEATAAGAGVGDEGGSSFVVVDFNNLQGNVTSGFNTLGIPETPFPSLQPELPPIIAADAVDVDIPPGGGSFGIVIPGGPTVDEGNLPDGSRPDPAALTQTGSFTVTAPDGLISLVVAGQTVIAGGVFTPVTLTTSLGNTLEITGFDSTRGEVSYRYTLSGNEQHGAGVITETFNVTATSSAGERVSGAFLVSILDDTPIARDNTSEVIEARGLDLNFAFVLDFSNSIDNTELNVMLDAVKAAAQQIFAKAEGEVNLSVVAFSATSLTFGPFTDYASFAAQLNALNPIDGGKRPFNGGTDFTDAIQATMAFFQPVEGASNQVLFLSDGHPNQQLGTDGNALLDTTAAAWSNFVTGNSIQVTAIGVGNDIRSNSLQHVDVDGEGAPILIDRFGELVDTLIPLVQPATVNGNLLADDTQGADGARMDSITVQTQAGLTTFTWDGANAITLSGAQTGTLTGSSFTVTTALGGTFTFYFADQDSNAAGQWLYVAPRNVAATTSEIISYTLVDDDGDPAGATLTVTVQDGNPTVTLAATPSQSEFAALSVPVTASPAMLQPATLQGNLIQESNTVGAIGVAFANSLAVTVAGVDLAGQFGTLHVTSAGYFAYTPYDGAQPESGEDHFRYALQHEDDSASLHTVAFEYSSGSVAVNHDPIFDSGSSLDMWSQLLQENDILVTDTLMLADAGDFPLPVLKAGQGDDTLIGSANSEVLSGGEGNDLLIAGEGNDILVGGDGDDILTGGGGSDLFVWREGNTGTDSVTDFTSGVGGDVLDLVDILQGEHGDAGSLGSYLSFSFDGRNTTITIDVDGAGPSSATQSIVLQSVDLTANNTLANTVIIANLLNDGNLRVDHP